MSNQRKITYTDGLAIVRNSNNSFQIYFDTIANRDNDFNGEPVTTADKNSLQKQIQLYKLLVPSERMRSQLHNGLTDWVSTRGADRLKSLPSGELIVLGNRMMNNSLDVCNTLTKDNFCVVKQFYNEDVLYITRSVVTTTRTLNDAIAFAAMCASKETAKVTLEEKGQPTFRYVVYELNALRQLEDNSPILYQTLPFIK